MRKKLLIRTPKIPTSMYTLSKVGGEKDASNVLY
jgi:hypothetical protein